MTWAKKEEDFVQAEPENPLFLEKRIPEETTEEMEEYMTNEANFRTVINSRKTWVRAAQMELATSLLKVQERRELSLFRSLSGHQV
jgi:hypothetical protein